jgi:hypothetical protein
LTYVGLQCFARLDACHARSFCQNGGTCIPVDLRSIQYVCQCPAQFHGERCQYSSAQISINLKHLWSDDQTKIEIPLVIVQLVDLVSQISVTTIENCDFFNNVPLNTDVIVYSQRWKLPMFAFVQVYFDADTSSDYYLVAFTKSNARVVRTRILSSNRCPHVKEYLDTSIMSMPYIQRVKHYFSPCLFVDTRCFYDEKNIFLCDAQANSDCLYFNHSESSCHTNKHVCLNNGQCYQSIPISAQSHVACVCPRCYFGEYCQLTLNKYTITLDALLDKKKSSSVNRLDTKRLRYNGHSLSFYYSPSLD